MQKNKKEQPKDQSIPKEKKPGLNEKYGFHFSSFLKITDPETGKVILHKRAD